MARTREEASREVEAIKRQFGSAPITAPRPPKKPLPPAVSTSPRQVVMTVQISTPKPAPVASPKTAPQALGRKKLTKHERWRRSEAKFVAIVQQLHKDRDDPTSPEYIDLKNLQGLSI